MLYYLSNIQFIFLKLHSCLLKLTQFMTNGVTFKCIDIVYLFSRKRNTDTILRRFIVLVSFD